MKPRDGAGSRSSPTEVQLALAGMDAVALRDVVRGVLAELDEHARERLARAILERRAPAGSGSVAPAFANTDVTEALAFAAGAKKAGHADPERVDDHLRRGTRAFLRKDYAGAYQILGALLPPITDVEVDLGQDEMFNEVLSVDASECALQYVVSAYMTSEPARRADAVRAAIDAMSGASYFLEPLREMERVAVEPLPGLDAFLPLWRAIVEAEAAGARHRSRDNEADRWLREVVRRVEGPRGLANIARSTGRAEDLRAWCESLMEAGDWQAALAACEQAAELVTDRASTRAGFFDAAALAARETGMKDLSPWLERAWRAAPTMPRLCRWLGAATTTPSIHERVTEALRACPSQALRQRAFLHVLQGNTERAAELLAAAPGLGWSDRDHAGHLLFPLFQAFLGGGGSSRPALVLPDGDLGIEELDALTAGGDDAPQRTTPTMDDILCAAGVEGGLDAKARIAMLGAMRTAAERRVAGVTEQKSRRHYGHAASLVASCAACDPSAETAQWAARLRKAYRRFPALCAEFERRMGRE